MVWELPFRADEVDSTPGVFSFPLLYFLLSFSFLIQFSPLACFHLILLLILQSVARFLGYRIFSNLGFLCCLFVGFYIV